MKTLILHKETGDEHIRWSCLPTLWFQNEFDQPGDFWQLTRRELKGRWWWKREVGHYERIRSLI